MASRKRSAVWLYYYIGKDPSKVVCSICLESIQHSGNTSNMRKHLRSKHHAEYADVEAKKRVEGAVWAAQHHCLQPTTQRQENNGTYSDMLGSVPGGEIKEQALKQEDDGGRTGNGIHNGEPGSSMTESRRLSVMWEYYQERHDGNSALCLLCSENVPHCRDENHLLRHLRKRHPVQYGYLEGSVTRGDLEEEGKEPTVHCSLRQSSLQEENCHISGRFPDIVEVITVGQSEQDQIRRALEQEMRALERERDLMEQLRRAQRQEARALEQQRALTEQMRRSQEEDMKRVRDQEAQALERERQAVEQMRRAQEQEARTLEQQRELSEQLRRVQEQEMKRVRDQEAQALERERQAIKQMRRAQEQEARAIEREREALEQLRRELEQDRHALQKQKQGQGQQDECQEKVTLDAQTPGAELELVTL